ncbi:acetyl-coenzyme A synthetase N-terminal domain-containing protein, partial [Cupriavidus taiwanensis]|uniref:acetyl-coenzyme A synthetase N-terminal domain-containing protein n=1 Tax=Cupriavidus taiwanensis TaxID=164546 RepID=UPI0025B6878F
MKLLESVMPAQQAIWPARTPARPAAIPSMDAYRALCDEAERDYEGFWARHARELLHWNKPFTKVLDESNAPFYKWFEDGQLNASYNCLDRNLQNGN